MFNEFQKELLQRVKARIEERTAQFICVAISQEVQAPANEEYGTRFSGGNRLKDEISFALDGMSCFELWLFSEVGIYPEDINADGREVWKRFAQAGWQRAMPREEFNNLCRVCRITWIERALETGSML